MRLHFFVSLRMVALGLAASLFFDFQSAAAALKSHGVPSDSSVEITITPWMENLPFVGMVPLTVRVANHSANDGKWFFTATENGYNIGMIKGHFTMAVPAGGSATETMLINLVPSGNASTKTFKNLVVNVSGPGVGMVGNVYLSSRSAASSTAKLSPYNAMSDEFEAAHGTKLKDVLTTEYRMEWFGETVTMKSAPTDWRGYTGIAHLWLMHTEWAALTEVQRQALLTWIGTGGNAYIVTADGAESVTLPEGMKWNDSVLNHGMGFLRLLAPDKVQNAAHKNAGDWAGNSQLLAQPGPMQDRLASLLPPLVMRGKLIFMFILVFGVTVGPLNLFWFARGANRPRLFWTTPLISFVGALALVVVMLFQDGIGGDGSRVLLSVLLPEQKQMVTLQEQFSKTGVLLRQGFELPEHETTWLAPMNVISVRKDRYGNEVEKIEGRSYELTGNRAEGGWFSSRSVQSHMLQSVRLNRGGIELQEGPTPIIVSSLATPLRRLWVMDSRHQVWTAENVATGQKVALKPSTEPEFRKWVDSSVKTKMGTFFRNRIEDAIPKTSRPAMFFAESAEPTRMVLPTLNSIRWDKDRAYLAGPVGN